MTTISIEAQISTEQLLRAIKHLPSSEFTTVVAQMLTLRAQRQAPHLSQPETVLLLQINQGLSEEALHGFSDLVAKRQAEAITPDELQELITLTNQIEQYDTRRLAALIELAQIRQVPVSELMDSLGITPSHG